MFITPWEVVKYSPLEKEFPGDKVASVLEHTEMEALNRFFGNDFREVLQLDLKLDSNVYLEYVLGNTYAANSKVIYEGLRYVSNVSTNKIPGSFPDPDWVVYEIFTEPKYNDLWIKYLRKALAFEIAEPAVTFATFKAKGNGLMTFADQNTGAVTANQSVYGIFKKGLQEQKDKIITLMEQWVREAHDTYDNPNESVFKEVSFLKYYSPTIQRNRRTRINFGV